MIGSLVKSLTGRGHEVREDTNHIVIRPDAARGMKEFLLKSVLEDFSDVKVGEDGQETVTMPVGRAQIYRKFLLEELPNLLLQEKKGIRIPKELWEMYEGVYKKKVKERRAENNRRRKESVMKGLRVTGSKITDVTNRVIPRNVADGMVGGVNIPGEGDQTYPDPT